MSITNFPKIIYGTAWKQDATADLVVKAVLQGYRAVDTACQPKHYREDLVGEALETLQTKHGIARDEIFLQTKFTSLDGQDRSKPLPYQPSASITTQVQQSFQTSLRNLRTARINALLLHGPLRTAQKTLEAWNAIVALKKENRVDLVGVSNVYDPRLLTYLTEGAGGVKPDIVQNRWYEGNDWDRDVVAYCLKEGIHYESFWTLTGSPALFNHPSIVKIAESRSCTPAQAIFRIAQQIGITPLAGSKNEKHMKDGLLAEHIDLNGLDDGNITEFVGPTAQA
ncbi:NADP-dependent oxidoreductase domain-containing protein [Cantharellus anzutake]|uniref:NADP-dependent oxidoreductase domain-containing protein n=1 Tax=Cantharellus anzutake TaxID=1750568 RepID=UPI0019066747|nr:NADP-dependent oxidoreductase domain-containing protein [Cantharellus anzutake]KAF8342003.1 NADP-dependent oxidoreductase domain-containing protein [Cantharellus anzutake]